MLRNVSRNIRRTSPAGALLALSLLAAACGSSQPSQPPQATVPQAAGTTTPATAVATDPYAVPPVITKPYVQKVLNALEAVNAQATDLIVANKNLVPAAAARLQSIYTDSQFTAQTRHLLTVLATGVGHTFRSDPGRITDAAARIVSASPTCVYLVTTRNYSTVVNNPPPPQQTYIALNRRTASVSLGLNPTPWVFAFLGYNTDGSMPANPCAAH